jgi:hypothetical protein
VEAHRRLLRGALSVFTKACQRLSYVVAFWWTGKASRCSIPNATTVQCSSILTAPNLVLLAHVENDRSQKNVDAASFALAAIEST